MTGSGLALDLGGRRAVHVVGMGGAGMSAISLVLAWMGHRVSGSDLRESGTLERLRAAGVTVHVGHDAAHLPDALDAVVVSSAIPDSNIEVVAARARGIPVLRRAEALAAIAATRRTIAVAGSHGKTTTSSMLALILRQAEWRPSFVIGGDLNEVGTNAAYDEGEWLVVEADESDGTFLELGPDAILVTNVEPDHLDHYGGFDALVEAFRQFIEAASIQVVCADDAIAARLGAAAGAVTYGFAAGADYHVAEYTGDRSGVRFVLERHGLRLGSIEIPVPGRHNALNAAGATALALELGANFADVVRAFAGFGGVARRFQYRGEVRGVTLIDDYAHLPGEVAAMVHAAREGDWRRVVVVFQPHRYSRTARLWHDFADSFCGADALVLTDVYPAGEAPRAGISGHLILRAVLDAHPDLPVTYLPRRADVVDHALDLARPGDVLLMLGAGDLTVVPDAWLARESEAAPSP